jgi:hypothetical protein
MKTYQEVEVLFHAFITLALHVCKLPALATLSPGKLPLAPIWWEARWASDLLWLLQRRKKNLLPLPNQFISRPPEAHHYTDCNVGS